LFSPFVMGEPRSETDLRVLSASYLSGPPTRL
jgi:hypothetical protein